MAPFFITHTIYKLKKRHIGAFLVFGGGRGEIRTHGGREPTTVFKTVALNRSATLPSFFNNISLVRAAL